MRSKKKLTPQRTSPAFKPHVENIMRQAKQFITGSQDAKRYTLMYRLCIGMKWEVMQRDYCYADVKAIEKRHKDLGWTVQIIEVR